MTWHIYFLIFYNMKRKIFLIFLSVFSLFSFVNNSFASENNSGNLESTEINIYKNKLKTTEKWRKFIEKIDEKVQDFSEEELLKYQSVLEKYLKTYKWNYYDIFEYLKAKIDYRISKLNLFSEINTDNYTTYINKSKMYKISSKKGEYILVEKNYDDEVDIIFANLNSGSSLSVVTEDYSETSVKDLKEYFDLSVEGIQNQFKPKDLKKESVELNGSKWYKVSYELTNSEIGSTMKLEQYIFENDKKISLHSYKMNYIRW